MILQPGFGLLCFADDGSAAGAYADFTGFAAVEDIVNDAGTAGVVDANGNDGFGIDGNDVGNSVNDFVNTDSVADLSDIDEDVADTDRLLVLVEEGTGNKELRAIADDSGAEVERVSDFEDGTRLAAVQIDPDNMQETAESLAQNDKVLIVQPNYKYRLEDTTVGSVDAVSSDDVNNISSSAAAENGSAGTAILSNDLEYIYVEDVKANVYSFRDGTASISNDKYLKLQSFLTQPDANIYSGSTLRGTAAGCADFVGAWKSLKSVPGVSNGKVSVAVIDTGALIRHPDLRANINKDLCVTFNDGKKGSFTEWDGYEDDHGHGTHVCGLIAAEVNNSLGVAGTAYNRAEVFCIDATNKEDNSLFTTQNICMSIDYAVEQGAKLINLSLGGLYRDLLMERSVSNAWDKGVLCICAAGNEGSDAAQSPGDSPCAISVKANDVYGKATGSSNYGPDKDVSAPGSGMFSTCLKTTRDSSGKLVPELPLTPTYEYKTGTSMATSVVTGTAVLLLSEDSSLTPRQLKNYIYTSSGQDSYMGMQIEPGFGIVNADRAVQNLHMGSQAVSDIILNRTYAEVCKGGSVSLEFAVLPAEAGRSADTAVYSSSDESVASVDQYGMITGTGKGTAVITVSCGGKTAECTVKVLPAEVTNFSKRPYTKSGYLEEDDQTAVVKENDWAEWESFTDVYQTKIKSKEKLKIDLTMYGIGSIPYLQITKKDGTVVAGRICRQSGSIKDMAMSYTAPEAGTYRIMVLNKPYSGTGNQSIKYKLTVNSEIRDLPDVSIKKPVSGKKAVTVRWAKLSKAKQKKISKIQIQYSTSAAFTSGTNKTVYARNTASSKKISGLRSDKYYYIRIRGYKKSSGVKHYSKWSETKKVRTK